MESKKGELMYGFSFGSGEMLTRGGFDTLTIGNNALTASNMPIFEVVRHNADAFAKNLLQGIVGIGSGIHYPEGWWYIRISKL